MTSQLVHSYLLEDMLLGTCYLSLSHKLIIILASILSCLLAFCGLLWALPAYSLYPQIPSPGAPVEYPGRRNIINHNQWKYPDTLAIRYFFKLHLCSTWSPGPMTKTPPSTSPSPLRFPQKPLLWALQMFLHTPMRRNMERHIHLTCGP